MTPEFRKANEEALDEAEFNQRVNPQAYQPEAHWVDAFENLGHGIAWFGFWVGLGIAVGFGFRS